MQLLSRPPGAAIAVFPQMLHDQADVLQMPDLGLGMAEPETLRVSANQFAGPLDECRRCRHCGRHLVGLFGRPSHSKWLATGGGSGKAAVALLARRSLAIPSKYRALKVHPPTAISRGAETASSRRFPTQTSKTANQTSIKTQGLGNSGAFGFRLIVFIVVIHPFGQNESSTHRRGHGGLGSPDRTPDDLVEFQIIRRIFAAQVHLV